MREILFPRDIRRRRRFEAESWMRRQCFGEDAFAAFVEVKAKRHDKRDQERAGRGHFPGGAPERAPINRLRVCIAVGGGFPKMRAEAAEGPCSQPDEVSAPQNDAERNKAGSGLKLKTGQHVENRKHAV